MSVLSATGLALILCALAGSLTGRLARHNVFGLDAIAWGLFGIQDAREGSWPWALVMAGGCAYLAWKWWTGGGGDGTKRRLRQLGKLFQPTRRTAPSPA
ncbi:hypothetical protein AB0M87_04690 [Streptomyces sp. NPDC051320]|uniref:hypothetical protein n=1 Tax=Streptomyces sp. NPDC051320 TaxID=3154644 RepID=UPI003438ED7C